MAKPPRTSMTVAATMLASVKNGSLAMVTGTGSDRRTETDWAVLLLSELASICKRKMLTCLFFVSVWQPHSAASVISARKRLNRRVIALILDTTKPQHANKVKNYGQTI